jgi:glutamine synthetase adenylyltransferase
MPKQTGPNLACDLIDLLHWRGKDHIAPFFSGCRVQNRNSQAYLRARPLSPEISLAKHWLTQQQLSAADRAELKRIREKLLRPVREDSLDLKYAPGGLLEIEFVVQTAMLDYQLTGTATSTLGMIEELGAQHSEWQLRAGELKTCYLRLREFEQMLQLSSLHATSEAKRLSDSFKKSERLLGFATDTAWLWLVDQLAAAKKILSNLDPLNG